MNRKKGMIGFLLCLSLCFSVGCGYKAEDGETETGRNTYIEREEITETERSIVESESRMVDQTVESTEQPIKEDMDSQSTETEGSLETEEVLLTREQIEEKNKISFSIPGNGMVDLKTFQPVSAEEIRSMVEVYTIPDYAYYDGHLRTKEDDRELLESRNLEAITEPVCLRYGIITKNAAVRSFPTQKTLTKEGLADDLDYMQESMFCVGEGVVVCHQTSDGAYSFVQGYQYNGWIQTECIGFCDKEEMVEFIEAESFVVVTDAMLNMKNQKLRMGTRLPLVQQTENGYLVKFPARDELGNLIYGQEEIPNQSGSLGYLNYTEELLLDQAYKMVGQPYGWGDTNENMDCSSTMNAIFKVFGILMPRNTSKLTLFSADVTDLSVMSIQEKKDTIYNAGIGSMILIPGHVVMYLGDLDGTPKILHNVTGYSVDGANVEKIMGCRITSMEIYNSEKIYYPELFTKLIVIR